ncbi:hypothetical protein CROQUDRAFT_35055 [Cronartium quercuum f. sp. fusiforme G11]|uniref:Uncharacterized protein n=1 Tax=Cronartium quercuum f. sp. fusiforme G11 TaxID=708437 RepID=A0A9P6NY59_9BASI|nr:hypothetical protein CROQUDRAFT_35055 [Cronartium quercuum f. sp. fusiforme G11]
MLVAISGLVEADCTGTINVTATAPEIYNLQYVPLGDRYTQDVGQITYTLDLAGNLNLTSASPMWHCGPMMNFVSSNATIKSKGKDDHKEASPAIHNVGAQLHCFNDPGGIDTTWATPWKTIVFYGSLFIELASDGTNCTQAANIVLDYSRCSYNTTTITGRNATGMPGELSGTFLLHQPPKNKYYSSSIH